MPDKTPLEHILRSPIPWRDDLLDRELRALAALVEAHREKFDGYLAGLESTVNLADARAKRKPKTATGRTGPRPL